MFLFKVCSDRNGLSAIDGIVVTVQNRPFSERFGIEFGLEFKDFSGQRRDTKVLVRFLLRLLSKDLFLVRFRFLRKNYERIA